MFSSSKIIWNGARTIIVATWQEIVFTFAQFGAVLLFDPHCDEKKLRWGFPTFGYYEWYFQESENNEETANWKFDWPNSLFTL